MTGWIVQVVEADGTPVGDPLDHLAGGSISLGLPDGASSPNRLSGLKIADKLPDMRGRFLTTSWVGDRGASEWWVLAPSLPRDLSETGVTRTLSGVDLTRLLSRVGLPRDEVLPVGRGVVECVDQLLTTYLPMHRRRFSVADIDTSLRAELAYSAGGDLLAATTEPLLAGAMTAWTPLPGGLVASTPWLPPSQRPTVPGFGDDTAPELSPFLGDSWSDDPQDGAPPPNEVLAVARGQAGDIVGRWADEADIYRHGAITVRVPGTVEAVDQAAADLAALRYREEHSRPRRELRFTGAWNPIRPGQVCRVVWARWGIDGAFECVGKDTSIDLAADTTYTMREA